MPKKNRTYTKPPLIHDDLLSRFADRGLIIQDTEKARHYLQKISYFRLSGYGLAYEKFGSDGERLHQFKEGTQFEDLLRAYVIDRKIRVMAMDAIERIEVAVRSTLNHEMSCTHCDSHWYLNKNLFSSTPIFQHKSFLGEVKRHTGKTANPGTDRHERREQFIHHYFDCYDHPDLPPCWMVAEVLPLGSWSRIYSHLKLSKDKKRISRQFDLSPLTMESWLHALTYLRNLCAHHSRIYFRPLVIHPKVDKKIPLDPVNRFANYAAIIHWFLQNISPSSEWLDRLEYLLINELPQEEHIRYGFKPEWREHPYWR